MQSKMAARKELTNEMSSPDECEKLYEEALWCLYALQDDLLQKDNPYIEEDRETISTCTSTMIYRVTHVLTIGCRDQADETTSRPMSRPHGHERPGSAAGCQRRCESLGRTPRSTSMGRSYPRSANPCIAAIAPPAITRPRCYHVLAIGDRCTLLLTISPVLDGCF